MPSLKKEKFLKEVLSYVKFSLDREDIKTELESHILEKVDYYIEQGYDKEKAEELSINDMGDAKEIGIELNKQHNPILGWIWYITNVMVGITIIFSVFVIGPLLVEPLFKANLINNIEKSNIVYKMNIDEKVNVDVTVIHFTNIIYEKNGDLSFFYEYYDTRMWGYGYSIGLIGEITDNLGNIYPYGPSEMQGGIKTKCMQTIKNFSKEADTLIISYDNYNRKYKVEIPLQVGDKNE
ncbi:permease prefix domain 1-containing protein [Clostridium sulfidigenes]|uniref:permease prefix domain 1-containing protein n=1 Tax=Clostridium sulfidigenes TaxID=318464 RepID=UPI003F898D5C